MDPAETNLITESPRDQKRDNPNPIHRKKAREYNGVDYGKLESELQRELEADKKYWIENDAKIRAVNSVGTYEDFRQIVLAAHLRPLDKKDKDSLTPGAAMNSRVIWNSAVTSIGKCCATASGEGLQPPEPVKTLTKVPTTLDAFVAGWKAMDSDDAAKANYLKKLTEDACPLKQIFSFEVPANILLEILEVLGNELCVVDTMLALRVLQLVAQSQRFAITTAFLTQLQREKISTIFSRIGKLLECEAPGDEVPLEENGSSIKEIILLFNTVQSLYSNLIE